VDGGAYDDQHATSGLIPAVGETRAQRQPSHRDGENARAAGSIVGVASLPPRSAAGAPRRTTAPGRRPVFCFGLTGGHGKEQRKGGAAIRLGAARPNPPDRNVSSVSLAGRATPRPHLMLTSAWIAPLAFRGLLRRETIQESSPPSSDQILLAAALAGMH